jgi:hypothetical protein
MAYELKTPPNDFQKNYKTNRVLSVIDTDNLFAKALNSTCFTIEDRDNIKVLLTPAFNRDIDIKKALDEHDLSVSYYNVGHEDDTCEGGIYKYFVFLWMKEGGNNRSKILKYASEIKHDLTENDYIFNYQTGNKSLSSNMSNNMFIQQTQVTGAKLETNSYLVQIEIDFKVFID